MNKITPQLTLLFYDYPQVFIGRDKIGTQLVCMATSENEDGPVYTCIQISETQKNSLIQGKIDLRSVYATPEIDTFFEAFPSNKSEEMSLVMLPPNGFDVNLLPGEDLFFDVYDEVAIKAAELNTTVSYVSLAVPESAESARIKSSTLSEFLSLFQNTIKYLTKIAAKENKLKISKDAPPFNTDVFGFSMGSFTVHIRSSTESDLLGDNALLSSALNRLNDFLESANNPDDAIKYLQSIKGHSAASLIKLLSFLSENSCPIRHRWANPDMQNSAKCEVSLGKINELVELCKRRGDLISEKITFRGIVSAADEKNRTWKIVNESDQAIYSGEVRADSDISLTGLVIGKGTYKFECDEVIETVLATGKEQKQYYLLGFEFIDSQP